MIFRSGRESESNSNLSLPDSMLSTSDNFLLPDGSYFNPDIGLDDESSQDDLIIQHWEPMRDKANEWLAKYGFESISQDDIDSGVAEISAEVGDDEEIISSNKAFLGLLLPMQELAGMKASVEDTTISSRYGNFAEDLLILPHGPGQTYHFTRNTSLTADMSYLDVPKLRLAIDIRPMRMGHSHTNDGKAALIGQRNEWIPFDSPIKGIYEIFSLYQDVNLGLKRDKRFPYLPQSLGGYGKPIPFREPSNFERFNRAFKQGTFAELNREIVRRTIVFLHNESLGFEQDRDPLLGHIVRFESQYHDWIKNRSIYAPVTRLDIPDKLLRHKAGQLTRNRVVNNALIRLAAEGRLITESKLAIALEHNALCDALLGSETIADFKSRRDKAISEWRTLSLYSLESYGFIKKLSLQGYGLKPLRAVEILRFISLVKEKRYNLKALLRDENFYWPEAMTEVYAHGPMMVHFRCYPRTKAGAFTFAEHEWDIPAIDTSEDDRLTDLENWLRNGAVGPQPTAMVNDDDEIVNQSRSDAIIALVTEDRNLCREINRVKGSPVFRVPVEWYYRSVAFGDADSPWVSKVKEWYPSFDVQEIIDSGSVESAEEHYFLFGVKSKTRMRQPFNIRREEGIDPLYFEEDDSPNGYDPPPGRPDFFDRRNILGLRSRRKRTFRRVSNLPMV
ncbi:RNA-dependent RNA polymerase [Suillus luteus narnavirus 4]|uniref:RNA-dependent RNA polymerase n=1 Tax=Suillus luteus narnavirus 4 TaxID=3067823 RepID=A0AA49X7F0_9VIRU|nr:RNA-dependent RNA polymerase [Suillus luteus narnavirus 4]